MDMFVSALAVLIILCVIIHLYTRQVQQQPKDPSFRGFQQTYLIVYLLAVGEHLAPETRRCQHVFLSSLSG